MSFLHSRIDLVQANFYQTFCDYDVNTKGITGKKYLQPTSSYNEKLFFEPESTIDIFKAACRCLFTIGIAAFRAISSLRERINNSNEITNTLSQTGIDANKTDVRWLYQLDKDDVKEIATIIGCLHDKKGDIVETMKSVVNNHTVTVYEHNDPATSATYKVLAKQGEISLETTENGNLTTTQLLTSAQFISSFVDDISNLNHLDLEDVDLTNKTLNQVTLRGTNLSNTILDGTQIVLDTSDFPELDQQWVQDLLNDYLSMVQSIDKQKYPDLVASLTKQILAALKSNDDISVFYPILLDFFNNNEELLSNKGIQDAAKALTLTKIPGQLTNEKISLYTALTYQKTIAEANEKLLNIKSIGELRILLDLVNAEKENKAEFMLKNNGFFVQLLSFGRHITKDQGINDAAIKLHVEYMNLKQLTKYGPEFVYMDDHHTFQNAKKDDHIFVFIKFDPVTKEENAFITSTRNMLSMVDAEYKDANVWGELRFFKDGELNPDAQVNRLFQQSFPLFHASYQENFNRCTFPNLIDNLPLNYVNKSGEIGVLTKDYREIFKAALTQDSASTKLCSVKDKNTLTKIFEQLLNPEVEGEFSRTITDDHFNDIVRIYALSEESNTLIAQRLFALATLMATFSSGSYFGIGDGNADGLANDSPDAIRHYTSALLTKAYQLDSQLFKRPEHIPDWNTTYGYAGWVCGLRGQALPDQGEIMLLHDIPNTCTEALRHELARHTVDTGFDDILYEMKPPNWSFKSGRA